MAQNFNQLPPSKRFKILNSDKISQPLYASNETNQKYLPAKKRAQNLNISSTSACLPAKKRVWAPNPVSPTKSETQAQDSNPLVEEKKRTKEGEANKGVPLKKRVWARCLLSPIKSETQNPGSDSDLVDVEGRSEVSEKLNLVPAKKRVLMENPLTPAIPKPLEEVADLKSLVKEVKEVKEINGVPAKKRVWAPNPLSVNPAVTEAKPPTSRRILSAVTNLKSVHEKDPSKELKEIAGDGSQKRVWDLNLLPAIQEVAEEFENLLTPVLLGNEEKENNRKTVDEKNPIEEGKGVKGIPVATKKRVWAPNPLSQTVTQSQTQHADSKCVREESHVNSRAAIQEVHAVKPVRAVHLLSPAKTGIQKGKNLKLSKQKTQNENQTKGEKENSPVLEKRQALVPEPPVKAQIQENSDPKPVNELSSVKTQIQESSEPKPVNEISSVKTQIQENSDPKPAKVRAQNEFEIKDERDKIGQVLLKQGCATDPLSPAKSQTQDEVKDTESIQEEEIDDGVACAVCQSTDGEPSDPIVFCDGCDLMVHASCYGNPLIKSIPEGDWFCFACSSKAPKKEKRCCLCPVKGGALKPTVDEKWAHVMCALLVPEVFFQDPEGRDGIDCSRVPHKRWRKDCFICGRNKGCAIDCAEGKCKLGFHVSCGLAEGLCIEYREGKGGDIVAGFCTEHTKLWEKQQLTGKFKIVPRNQELDRKTV
ncbi:PHD finger family protein [Rhynchospora pubera]|uniref:PHD finger family protein n=1 Tax=Rhynchospora pubera TaxID=906938 RepID=A0AAV8DAU7_9POAL|nr:PHD finger family protein [Rhynchospora pubera]KAJ4818686.1 PHD finger family protein [Rhynchospora pubera]